MNSRAKRRGPDPGRDGEDVGVEDEVLRLEPGLLGEQAVGALADLDLARGRLGLAALVERHHHHRRAVAAHQPRLGEEVRLALLEAEAVDDGLALHALEPPEDRAPPGAVDHDGDPGDLGLAADQGEEAAHGRLGVEHRVVEVDVDDVGAAADLLERHPDRGRVVPAPDQVGELLGPGDVGALADHDERRVGGDGERLEPREPGGRPGRRAPARSHAGHRRRDGPNVVGGGAAAAAEHVDQPVLGERAQQPRRRRGVLVELAEGVGQPGVRVQGDGHLGDRGELLEEGADLARPEGAVEPDGERPCVAHGGVEGLQRLPGEDAPAPVDHGAGDHQRHPPSERLEHLLDGHDAGLQVEGVEHRLGQEQVHPALEQRPDLLRVGLAHLGEGDRPVARVAHVGGHRQALVERAEGAGDEARPRRVPLGEAVRRRPGEAGRRAVQLRHHRLQPVIGLGDARRVEGVGLDEVRPRLEVRRVDLGDDRRLGEDQQVVVPPEIARVVPEPLAAERCLVEAAALDHRPHRAVEEQDAALEQVAQGRFGVHGHGSPGTFLAGAVASRPAAGSSRACPATRRGDALTLKGRPANLGGAWVPTSSPR